MDTFHKDYNMTRKVLSAAFFKQKLQALTRVIKEEVVEMIFECQQSGETEVDLVEFFGKMQSRIFTSMAVGKNNANVICNYELENGNIIQKPIG